MMRSVKAGMIRRWFAYERVAHAKVVRSLGTVPEARRSSSEFARAVAILGHIAAARRMWLYRFGVLDQPPSALFPQAAGPDAVAADLSDVEALWEAYLDRLDDAEIDREFEYQSLDAGRFRNRVEEILTQLFGHSWYHRGQIALLVRAAGGEPAVTDYVYWCRVPAGPG